MRDQQVADTYVLEASEAEHSRLIEAARLAADNVRELCARAGVREGARFADIGCGPIGALVELAAEIAGPHGSVVGIDSSAEAVKYRAGDRRAPGSHDGTGGPWRHSHAGPGRVYGWQCV
jgi:cyclopropane fatty-acyl-phospholipid synthase-like methyltransferase